MNMVKVQQSIGKKPLQVVEQLVEGHRKHAPELDMRMAIWLNPQNKQPLFWKEGIELLEICQKVVIDPEPDFRATRFPSSFKSEAGLIVPELRLILTSPGELNLALEIEEGHPGFAKKLEKKLRDRAARIVFSASGKKDFGEYQKLLKG